MKKIYYGKAVYDNKEINAVLDVLKNESLSLIDGKQNFFVKKIKIINCKIPDKVTPIDRFFAKF